MIASSGTQYERLGTSAFCLVNPSLSVADMPLSIFVSPILDHRYSNSHPFVLETDVLIRHMTVDAALIICLKFQHVVVPLFQGNRTPK